MKSLRLAGVLGGWFWGRAVEELMNVGAVPVGVACCWGLGRNERSGKFGQETKQKNTSVGGLPESRTAFEGNDARLLCGARPTEFRIKEALIRLGEIHGGALRPRGLG